MRIHGRHYLTGEPCQIGAEGGLITSVTKLDAAQAGDLWLAPGLLDIQVNGYKGITFGSDELTVDGVATVAQDLASAGVTGFCATVTTASRAVTEASVRTIARACETSPLARQRILSIHLEGPFISPLDGPRGAHPRQHVRNPDWDEIARLQKAANGKIGIITLAPELPGALDVITRARDAGLVAAIGHHAATREQINAAVDAGAVLSTHLGNGAHSELPRHHNYIWEQLAHDGLMASIIVDGHHLPPAVVKSFYRAKGESRLILISDVAPIAGLAPGHHSFMGADVELREDGFLSLSGTPYLAGSTLKLSDAIANVMSFAGASFASAISMGTANPAKLLGVQRERGSLTVGSRADLAVFRMVGGRPVLAQTICGGELCYTA
jgi:N-acetylglucosamine-6-phosphate deacetylase